MSFSVNHNANSIIVGHRKSDGTWEEHSFLEDDANLKVKVQAHLDAKKEEAIADHINKALQRVDNVIAQKKKRRSSFK